MVYTAKYAINHGLYCEQIHLYLFYYGLVLPTITRRELLRHGGGVQHGQRVWDQVRRRDGELEPGACSLIKSSGMWIQELRRVLGPGGVYRPSHYIANS
jgi:hypothetical protein